MVTGVSDGERFTIAFKNPNGQAQPVQEEYFDFRPASDPTVCSPARNSALRTGFRSLPLLNSISFTRVRRNRERIPSDGFIRRARDPLVRIFWNAHLR